MAAPSAPTFEDIRKSVRAGQLAPVYLLHGKEGYFIDALVEDFRNALPEDDREFNLYILHGPETDASTITDLCYSVPMMADRQMVILKEAQAMRADQLNKLAAYVADPVPTSTLVIVVRGEQAKGKDLLAALRKSGAVMFESKEVRDYNIPAFIGSYIRSKGLSAEQKSLEMLRDYIGTDLSRLYNEVDKLAMLLPEGAAVTPEVVERNIGVSREYNTFELVDAFAEKDAPKVFRILSYFRSNPKSAPMVMVTAGVFNLFADLLTAYYAEDQSNQGIMKALGLRNEFAVRRIRTGMSNYSPVKIVEIITAIRRYDSMSKGVNSRQNEHQLFMDLAYHILTASGRV